MDDSGYLVEHPVDRESGMRTRVIHFFWGLFPWLMVAAMIGFITFMGKSLVVKHAQLAEARSAGMKKEIPAVRVITLVVQPKRLVDKIRLPAEVKPYEELWIKTEAKGQVVELSAREGADVRKGQLLLKLDDRDYRSRLEGIEAGHKLAGLELNRTRILAKKNFAAESKLNEDEARYSELDAQMREAALALDRTRISAPVAGRINEITAKLGDVLDVNQPVAELLQIDRVKVTVGVPESDVAAVFALDEARLVIEALDNRSVVGKKVFLASKPKSLARLYDLELVVENPDGRILPGMFADVELVKKIHEDALAVPLYAVVIQGNDRFVYVEKDGKAERRPIELGVLVDWQVHVKAGLAPGEHVIVVGHRFLDDAQAVDVIRRVERPEEIFAS